MPESSKKLNINSSHKTLISNVTGKPMNDPEEIKKLLINPIKHGKKSFEK